ncbi:RNA polymerase sigma factor [Nocardioides sp. NPDC092400]|uniref:RNA polymerase sigma factor n=1 Tax=Nocardioides sp. NPDC092400 TaxID=3155196 RepID=UPI0034448497
MTTDSEIVRSSIDDPPAFAAIFDRHAAAIHRFAARRTDPTVADDVLSQTFLVAFERRRHFDLARESAVPWLYGIATRVLHRHRRDEVRMLRALARVPGESLEGDVGPTVDDQVDAQRTVAGLAQALRSLTSAHWDALLLLAWADLSYEQIAEALDVPTGAVRSRISRARATLRAATPTSPVPHPAATWRP